MLFAPYATASTGRREARRPAEPRCRRSNPVPRDHPGGGPPQGSHKVIPAFLTVGGTPANLQAVAANINGSAFFAFLGGAALGFNAAYPSLNLLSDLTPAGRAALAKLGTMCQGEALPAYSGKRIQDYTAGGINPITEPRWQRVLDDNDLGALKPRVPVL